MAASPAAVPIAELRRHRGRARPRPNGSAMPDSVGAPRDRSFEAVYTSTASFIRGVVRKLVLPHSDVEDTVQDVYVIAYRKWTRLEESVQNVRAWLYAIAVRTCWNHRRARRRWNSRHDHLEWHDEREALAQSDLTPEMELAERQTLDWLSSAIARLDDKKREALLLTQVEQLTAIEVARRTGLSPNTVASRLRAALVELRRDAPPDPAIPDASRSAQRGAG